ncbi:MAG: hypothetical protein V1704_00165 [Candidatus Vogelbacteria bacterium]
MSSLVLLNSDGIVARKLQLVSLPSGYVVPEGMIVSWRTELSVSSSLPVPFSTISSSREPVEAFFYLGKAQGQVYRDEFKKFERDSQNGTMRYNSRRLTITVQGTSAKDVMELRDRIMHLIHSCVSWSASNDLNPKPRRGFLQRLKKMVGMTRE